MHQRLGQMVDNLSCSVSSITERLWQAINVRNTRIMLKDTNSSYNRKLHFPSCMSFKFDKLCS